MTKKRWITLVAVVVTVQLVWFTNAFGLKRIGAFYPVQGVFVTYCTDTNETPTPAPTPDCKYSYSSTTWKTIPGATQSFTISADEVKTAQALILARFSGQARCIDGPGSCVVRMLLTLPGGTSSVMKPYPAPNGLGLYFQNTSSGSGYEAHMVEQVYPNNVGAGTYKVSVQAAIQANSGATTNPTFQFAGWSLTTEIAYDQYV